MGALWFLLGCYAGPAIGTGLYVFFDERKRNGVVVGIFVGFVIGLFWPLAIHSALKDRAEAKGRA